MTNSEAGAVSARELRRAYVELLMNVSVGAHRRTLRDAQRTHMRFVYAAFAFLYAAPFFGFTPIFLGADTTVGLTIFAVCIGLYFSILILSSRKYTAEYQSAVRTLQGNADATELVALYSQWNP